MVEFVVHGIPGSPYVRSALLGLEEKGAPWRLAALGMGEHRAPAFRAHHPFCRIPVLYEGDFRLYETQAILRYLDRILPTPPLTVTEPRLEARMNQVCGVVDSYVTREISAPITFPRRVAPRFGLPVDEAAIVAALPAAERCTAELARLLGDGPFFAGATLSIADLMLAPHLDYFEMTEEGAAMLAPHPGLLAWLDRVRARPSMERTTWERLTDAAMAA